MGTAGCRKDLYKLLIHRYYNNIIIYIGKAIEITYAFQL